MTPASPTPEGCYLVDPQGVRFLNLGFTDPLEQEDPSTYEQRCDLGERLRRAFSEECSAQQILGSLTGAAAALQVEFAGQENASPDLVFQAFGDEMRAGGVLVGQTLRLHPAMNTVDGEHAEHALRHAVRRLRTLLIEHNSYLSGGLAYPFLPSAPGAAERGLAIYRFPATAEVDVTTEKDHVKIVFAPAELGEVTSSGFYLPTLFRGDFTVSIEYQLGTWLPCAEDAACFALFAQNESSTHRYYAQRMSTGRQPHRLLMTVVDQPMAEHDVAGDRGAFKITRRGDQITCMHRLGDKLMSHEWILLGQSQGPVERDMVVGAKIWSKVRCDGLEARVYNLRIEGRLAENQIPPVPVKPDPRSDPGVHP